MAKAPRTQEHAQGKTTQGQQQGNDESFLIGGNPPFFQIPPAQTFQFRKQPVPGQAINPDVERTAPPYGGQLGQGGHVQASHHHFAFFVFHETRGATTIVLGRDQAPAFFAHAHGDEPDSVLVAGFGLLFPITFQVLTVGDQEDGLEGSSGGTLATFGQKFTASFQSGADGRPLFGHHVGAGHLEEDTRGSIVQGQGTLDEGRPREKDQPDPAAFQPTQETVEFRFGPFHPVGGYVLGEHGI